MITLKRLLEIKNSIKEYKNSVNESIDHSSVKDIINLSHKMLSAIEGIKTSAPHAMINALTPHIDKVQKILEDMVENPTSYVDKNLQPKETMQSKKEFVKIKSLK